MDFLQQLHTLRSEIRQLSIPLGRRDFLPSLLSELDRLIDVAIPYVESVLLSTSSTKLAVFKLDERWWKTLDSIICDASYFQHWFGTLGPFDQLIVVVASLKQWTIDHVCDDETTVDDLIAMLDAPNYHLRHEAVTRLGNYPAVLTILIPDLMQIMVNSVSIRLKFAIERTLGTVSYAAVPYLMPLLEKGQDDTLRRHAMWVIPLMGLDALKAIVETWPNADDDLRWTMTSLLSSLPRSPEMVMPLLLEALQSEDSRIQFEAIEALEYFRGFASDAVPALEKLLHSEPRTARRRLIRRVLKLITESAS